MTTLQDADALYRASPHPRIKSGASSNPLPKGEGIAQCTRVICIAGSYQSYLALWRLSRNAKSSTSVMLSGAKHLAFFATYKDEILRLRLRMTLRRSLL